MTALQVQQGTLATLLSDPDRLREFPIETVERLFALDKEMRQERAQQAFNAAFMAVQEGIVPVNKESQIRRKDGSITLYAKVNAVVKMLDPLLFEHGFSRSLSQAPCDKPGRSMFCLTLRHIGGHTEKHYYETSTGGGSAPGMNEAQKDASTASYAEKTALCKAFGVILVDDRDGEDPKGQEPISEQQVHDLNCLIDEIQPGPGFMRYLKEVFQVERPEQIAAADYGKVVRALEQKRRAKQ